MSTVPQYSVHCLIPMAMCFLIYPTPLIWLILWICSSTSDLIAPLKSRSNSKTRKQSSLSDSIQSCEKKCRKSRTKMEDMVSLGLLCGYERMVEDVTTCYLSELVLSNQHNSRFLFKTVDQLLNPASTCVSVDSDTVHENSFFAVKKTYYSKSYCFRC